MERLLRRITTRRGREAEGVVLLEGVRATGTALARGAHIRFALVAEGAHPELARRIAAAGGDVVEVPGSVLAEFAQTEAPQGLLAVAEEPSTPPLDPSQAGSGGWLVLDAVRDPGNVGTLVRTAAVLGVERVVALDGTADPWGAKAVRASAGNAFGIPVHALEWAAFRELREASGVPLLVADAAGQDVRVRAGEDGRSEGGWALLVGNEGEGARSEARSEATALLAIPIRDGTDSLNVSVAGAILLWELLRRSDGVRP